MQHAHKKPRFSFLQVNTHTNPEDFSSTIVCFVLFLFSCGWVANKNMSLAILVLSSIPMNWTVFITIHKFNWIQFSHDWFSSSSFVQNCGLWIEFGRIAFFFWHFFHNKIMSRQKKKTLQFCFYFVLFIYAHPNFPIWLFLFHSWQASWVSLSLMLHASMNWWITQFQSILIQSNSIQLISL